jgi:hypothetical protein
LVRRFRDLFRFRRHFSYLMKQIPKLLIACRPCLVPQIWVQNVLCKNKIPRHIKIPAHAWSTKCRWNQKLITQFCCTLRDEHYEHN